MMRRLRVEDEIDCCLGAGMALFCIIAAIMVAVSAYNSWKAPTEYESKCLGCGTEFVSDQPSEDVTVCPNCPMSEEELKRLIEEIERGRKQ